MYHLMNVYSHPATGLANKWLAHNVDDLPQLTYMGGDFNCRSSIWDPDLTTSPAEAESLVACGATLGLVLSVAPERAPTHFPHSKKFKPSVIDLMFLPAWS